MRTPRLITVVQPDAALRAHGGGLVLGELRRGAELS